MTFLLLLGLAVAVWLLWSEVRALRVRIALLEAAWHDAPAVAAPIVETPYEEEPAAPPLPELPPEPEPMPVRFEAPAAEPPVPEPVVETVAPASRSFGFEEIFGRRLPIWAGGVTLAVAGFLIVKYSIEAGLLSPAIRVVFGLLFGCGLIGGAELARRMADRVRDPRVSQALAGAGVATLYATVLVAANLYGLIGSGTAFVALALITILAGFLSIRFGPASALLGLVGGLAAPALVGAGQPNMPLLAAYLALAVGGLCALGRKQGWLWLGAAALAGGFGWGLVLILSGALDFTAALSLGFYTLLIGIAFPLLLSGGAERALRAAGALLGCAQMAALVATGGFSALNWGLYGLISIATVWLSRRDERLSALPLPALAIALLLASAWPAPAPTLLAAVLAGLVPIYGAPALLTLWRRGGLSDAIQLAALAFAIPLVPLIHFHAMTAHVRFAPLALMGALLAAGAAGLGCRTDGRRDDARFALLAISAAALLGLAASLALPEWMLAPAVALLAAGLLLLGRRADDERVTNGAWSFGAAAIAFLLLTAHGPDELLRCFGVEAGQPAWLAALRWVVPGAVALLFRAMSRGRLRDSAQIAAVLLFYGTAAQLLPALFLPLVPAVALPGIALASRARKADAALGTAAAIAAGWAIAPLGTWAVAGLAALAGEPFYVSALPPLADVATRVAAPALGLAALLALRDFPERMRLLIIGEAGALGAVALHAFYKQLFAIGGASAFVAYGMAERTVWEMLLAGAAFVAWRAGWRTVAIGAAIVSLFHFAWFSLLLHDPLWSRQMAGPWLIPAYGTAAALLWAAGRLPLGATLIRLRDGAQMALILLFAASALRQIFHGSMLSMGGVSSAEDILRSVLAIGIAVGFLVWGIRQRKQDWRVASLLLMLCAVAKVFLFDAAGLDGLLRIASFAALGFSLIGVGWLYSRYLPDARQSESA